MKLRWVPLYNAPKASISATDSPVIAAATPPPTHRVSIRVDLASGARIGPGKVALLEEIARSGSISGAGRALKMSYRRAWELVEDLNRHLGTPEYWRVRLGIGHPGDKARVHGHVLGDFHKVDRDWLVALLDAVANAAPMLAGGKPEDFMTRVALLTQETR